ncbi:MAG TPA: hypothetical protein VNS58_06825 [Puia sp.]|nr:hypothetical protein [Puia sp.]
MHIKLNKSSYFFGEAIPVKVCFENPSKETMVLEDPSKSADVMLHLIDVGDQQDYYYYMKKMQVLITDPKKDQYVIVDPPKEHISISPSSSFEFTTNANERLYLQPGTYNCYVSEGNDESNKVEIKIVFNQHSVDHFFMIAQNADMEYSRRDWAMKAIQRIYPRFKLNLVTENDPKDSKTKKEAENIPVYHEFEEWWKKNKDTKEVKSLFNQ